MKVLLLFPPQWVPYQPYLSLPSLAAFLRAGGVEVVQKDLNIESYDAFLSRPYLRSLKGRLDRLFAGQDTKPVLEPGPEQQLYSDLFLARASVHHLADAIEGAKAVFRSPRYYDANALSAARKTIENALAVASAAHYPSRLDLMSFNMPSYDGTFESIDRLTLDRNQNPYLEHFEKTVLPYLRDQAPDVIGISIAGESQLLPALTLSRLIKSSLPDGHVVLGGYLVTLLADVFVKNKQFFQTYCDSLIVLEGERPLLELVRRLDKHESLDGVPNLIYIADDGEVRQNPPAAPEPMDSLPAPDFDGLPLQKYLNPEPVLPLLASRGCYWGKCVFCSHNVSYENKYRAAAAEKIAADLETLHRRHGARKFAFSDEAIAPRLMRELTAELLKRQADFRFSTNIRLEPQFTAELCLKMGQAGFRVVYLGLESGCDRVLGLMKKGFTKEGALKICRNLIEAGIWDHLYVFLGFPGESEAEAQETMQFLLANGDAVRSFNIGAFTLARGSAVMASPEEFGVTLPPGDFSANLNVGFAYALSPGIPREQALLMSDEAWTRLAATHPTRDILRLLSKEDLLLYLSHYEATDPQLSNIHSPLPSVGEGRVMGQSCPDSQLITRHSQPRLAPGVIRAAINFDLPSIRKAVGSGNETAARPAATRVLFNPENRKLKAVDPQTWEILGLGDGAKTVRMIARHLAKKYGAPEAELERFCLESLGELAREGYVEAKT